MAQRTVNIGLSLGADICWPIAYETLLDRLALDLKLGRDRVSFACERVTIEPFDLRQPVKYDVVIDRLTHWYTISREWIKKAVVLNDLYVYNNPWSIQSNEKHTSYAAMMRLGLPIPETWMLPAKSYEHADDLEPTLRQYAKMFSLKEIGEKIGYPFFMKPYHGGGWRGVTKIDNLAGFQKAYDASGTDLMNLQKAVIPYDWFVRCIGLGPQTRKVNYDPSAALHDRYTMDTNFLSATDAQVLEDTTLTINAFFGWDFNSCEALAQGGVWYPIDFANACPDSQVTSLHYHFPWLIKANLRWSIFCAATGRKMRKTMDWEPLDLSDATRTIALSPEQSYAAAKRAMYAEGWRDISATIGKDTSSLGLIYGRGGRYLRRPEDGLAISVDASKIKPGKSDLWIAVDSYRTSARELRDRLFDRIDAEEFRTTQ